VTASESVLYAGWRAMSERSASVEGVDVAAFLAFFTVVAVARQVNARDARVVLYVRGACDGVCDCVPVLFRELKSGCNQCGCGFCWGPLMPMVCGLGAVFAGAAERAADSRRRRDAEGSGGGGGGGGGGGQEADGKGEGAVGESGAVG